MISCLGNTKNNNNTNSMFSMCKSGFYTFSKSSKIQAMIFSFWSTKIKTAALTTCWLCAREGLALLRMCIKLLLGHDMNYKHPTSFYSQNLELSIWWLFVSGLQKDDHIKECSLNSKTWTYSARLRSRKAIASCERVCCEQYNELDLLKSHKDNLSQHSTLNRSTLLWFSKTQTHKIDDLSPLISKMSTSSIYVCAWGKELENIQTIQTQLSDTTEQPTTLDLFLLKEPEQNSMMVCCLCSPKLGHYSTMTLSGKRDFKLSRLYKASFWYLGTTKHSTLLLFVFKMLRQRCMILCFCSPKLEYVATCLLRLSTT
jgi:hypothetical protein